MFPIRISICLSPMMTPLSCAYVYCVRLLDLILYLVYIFLFDFVVLILKKKMKGSQSLRQRLHLSTLSWKPIIIDDICSEDMIPGLRPHEMSLLRLFDNVHHRELTKPGFN